LTIKKNGHKLVIVFARIWPDVVCWPFSSLYLKGIDLLNTSGHQQKKINPILTVVIYIVKRRVCDDSSLYSPKITPINVDTSTGGSESSTNELNNLSIACKYTLYILETLCNWSQDFRTSLQVWEYLKNDLDVNSALCSADIYIINENEFKLSPLMFENLKAIQLLCSFEGWRWTVDTFIKKIINQFLEHFTEIKSKNSEHSSKAIHLIAYLLYVQGSILSQMCPKHESSRVIETMNLFCNLILNNKQKEGITITILSTF
jgi:hypothetical protein